MKAVLELKQADPLRWEYLGPLSGAEAEACLASKAKDGAIGIGARPIAKLRTRHHELARLFASGLSDVEISRISGYQPAWLSTLSRDPSFKELIAFYQGERDVAMIDVQARIGTLAIGAMDEIQGRLDEDPEGFTNGELQKLMDSALDRTGFGVQTKSTSVHVHASASLDEIKRRVLENQRGHVQTRDQELDLRSEAAEPARLLTEAEASPGEQGSGPLLREEGGESNQREVA